MLYIDIQKDSDCGFSFLDYSPYICTVIIYIMHLALSLNDPCMKTKHIGTFIGIGLGHLTISDLYPLSVNCPVNSAVVVNILLSLYKQLRGC